MSDKLDARSWERICHFFSEASHVTSRIGRGVPCCSLVTVDADGVPRVTPVSTVLLGERCRAVYFDHFSRHTSKNLDRDPRLCVLIVNNQHSFWKKALLRGKLDGPPAVRLFGSAQEKRQASEQELNALRRPIRALRWFRGYEPLWGVMETVREIRFDRFERIRCGPLAETEML